MLPENFFSAQCLISFGLIGAGLLALGDDCKVLMCWFLLYACVESLKK